MDDIDELVDYQLTLPHYGSPYELHAKCERCKKEWHGLTKDGCPGLTGIVGIPTNAISGCGYA